MLRNREHILAVAREAFTQRGADVSMNDVAKIAGVGAGTLYRHFPNREALLEGVYCDGLDRLAAAEAELSSQLTPIEALEAWLLLFVDYVETKKLILPAIHVIVADESRLFECSGSTLTSASTRLVRRAVESGDLRDDIQPLDLLWALYGANSPRADDWSRRARRLIGILMRGVKR